MLNENLIVGIGTGWPAGSPEGCNAISAAIANRADFLADQKRSQLLLVGGNGIKDGLPEAFRMKRLIKKAPIVFTDCDGGDFTPSHNTPTNGVNIAEFVKRKNIESCGLVAVRQHLPRVIACVRKALYTRGLIDSVEMTGYPVDAPFENNNAQVQLRSETNFLIWTWMANVEHLLCGRVLAKEYIRMLLGEKSPVAIID